MSFFREWEAQKYFWVGVLNITATLLIIYILSKYRKAPTSEKKLIFNSTKNAARPQMDFLQSWQLLYLCWSCLYAWPKSLYSIIDVKSNMSGFFLLFCICFVYSLVIIKVAISTKPFIFFDIWYVFVSTS